VVEVAGKILKIAIAINTHPGLVASTAVQLHARLVDRSFQLRQVIRIESE